MQKCISIPCLPRFSLISKMIKYSSQVKFTHLIWTSNLAIEKVEEYQILSKLTYNLGDVLHMQVPNYRFGRRTTAGSPFWSFGWQRPNEALMVWKMHHLLQYVQRIYWHRALFPLPWSRCYCLKAEASNGKNTTTKINPTPEQTGNRLQRSDHPHWKFTVSWMIKIISNLSLKAFLRQHDHTVASYGQLIQIIIKELFKRHCSNFSVEKHDLWWQVTVITYFSLISGLNKKETYDKLPRCQTSYKIYH